MSMAAKSRVVPALLLASLGAAVIQVRSADAPLRPAPAISWPEVKATPPRASRGVSRQEIFQAIQDELARQGMRGWEGLRPGDLNIQASLPRLETDMGLRVTKIGFDPVRREMVFRLAAAEEPQYLPIQVTLRRDPQSSGFISPYGRTEGANSEAGNGPARARSRAKPPVLAKPGVPATLILLGPNVRMTMTVVPLQPGSRGQTIWVRDVATARVLTAEVVDEGLLQASF